MSLKYCFQRDLRGKAINCPAGVSSGRKTKKSLKTEPCGGAGGPPKGLLLGILFYPRRTHFKILGLDRLGDMSPTPRAASWPALGTGGPVLARLVPETCASCNRLVEGRSQQRPRSFCGFSGQNASFAGLGCLFPGAASRSEEPGSSLLGSLSPCPVLHASLQPRVQQKDFFTARGSNLSPFTPWAEGGL